MSDAEPESAYCDELDDGKLGAGRALAEGALAALDAGNVRAARALLLMLLGGRF
jgi:hypothetical protein